MQRARSIGARAVAMACFACLTAGVAPALAASAMQGVWEAQAMASGPGAPWWERSRAVVASDGSFTGYANSSGGDADTVHSRFDLSSAGILTLEGLGGFRGALDVGNTVFAGTGTWDSGAPGTTELRIGLRMAPSYALADLAGEWELNILASGPGAPWWERGHVSIAADGHFNGALTENSGATDAVSGTFGLSSAGVLTFSGSGNARGVLDEDHSVLVMTSTWTGFAAGTTDLSVGVKMANSYTLADLVGAWEVYGLATGPGAPRWSRNHVLVRPDGSFVSDDLESDGTTDHSTGTLSITPSGILARAGAPNARGALDAGKSVMVWTDTWTSEAPGTTVLEIAVKTSATTASVSGNQLAPLTIALARTNPAGGGALRVRFSLPDASPAWLDLLDVHGRRLATERVESVGTGEQFRDLGAGRSLSPGLYFARLRQGARSAVTRAVVLR